MEEEDWVASEGWGGRAMGGGATIDIGGAGGFMALSPSPEPWLKPGGRLALPYLSVPECCIVLFPAMFPAAAVTSSAPWPADICFKKSAAVVSGGKGEGERGMWDISWRGSEG